MSTTTIDQSKLSYISDAEGKPQSVIVPIDVWNSIRLHIDQEIKWPGPAMSRRIHEAINNTEALIPFDEVIRRLGITRKEIDAVD